MIWSERGEDGLVVLREFQVQIPNSRSGINHDSVVQHSIKQVEEGKRVLSPLDCHESPDQCYAS